MPCYDGREREDRYQEGYERGLREGTNGTYKSNPDDTNQIGKLISENVGLRQKLVPLNDKIDRLEASLCAILTELEKEGIAPKVIHNASREGMIDLVRFWVEHKKDDEARLTQKMYAFSEHEKDMLRKMFKEGKI